MKKLNKFFAVLVALAMMATLCVSMAFAEGWTEGVDATPDNATLTKRVETPKETTLKAGNFTFTFNQLDTAEELAGETLAIETASAPIGTREISIAAANKVDPKGDNDVYLNTALLFANPESVKGATAQKPFPHAGVYKYTVTETAGYTAADASETVHNSQAQYTVYITVANTKDGKDLYIKDIVVVKDKTDGGQDNVPGDGETKKVDEDGNGGDTITTPATETTEEEVNPVGTQFAFTNTYVKTLSTDPNGKDDPNDPTKDDNDAEALYVQKILVDTKGIADLEKEYTFDVSIYVPTLAPEASYVAEIWDVNGTVVNANGFTAERGKTTSDTVELKAGQRLVFKALPVGSKYTVAEQNPGNKYTVDAAASTAVNTAKTGVDEQTIKQANNFVRVTNTVNDETTTPTGILISNLPYIALALVAIGGLVAYVVVRRRQSDEA